MRNIRKKLFLLVNVLALAATLRAQVIGRNSITSAGSNFNQYLTKTALKNIEGSGAKGSVINSFNNVENTKGTRFLFDNWVNGDSIMGVQENFINTTSFLFNYDKMTDNLLVTQDKVNIMSVAPDGINSFILKNNDKLYLFEHVKAIDPAKFFLNLVKSDTGYSVYKKLGVRFVQANVRNDGMIKTGNDYDEYVDESQYYIVAKLNTVKPVSLKPKVIKAALEDKKDKVDAYFKQHREDIIDETFLTGLIAFLNK